VTATDKDRLSVVVEEEETFITPYSDRMSLTPEEAPVKMSAQGELSSQSGQVTEIKTDDEESQSPGVSVELNHRLRFLKHPPAPVYS
jgi:hypothetical protein